LNGWRSDDCQGKRRWHLGARTRSDLDMRSVIKAPAGLLDWKGPDRAVVSILDVAKLEQIGPALGRVVEAWAREPTRHVSGG
jgi:hypothetical protein